ncbi:MAG: preprotein translocase subunit SecG [Clostridia bacterium]|nr:preprotein translocase subunit SecG [Clostridia bacterium]
MSYELALTLKIILLVVMALSAAFLIFAIVKQPGNSSGSDAITGAGSTDTFYGKNKAKRFENQLKKWTIICGIILAVCSVLFFVIGLL